MPCKKKSSTGSSAMKTGKKLCCFVVVDVVVDGVECGGIVEEEVDTKPFASS